MDNTTKDAAIRNLTDERDNLYNQLNSIAILLDMIFAPEGHNPIHVSDARIELTTFATGWIEARVAQHEAEQAAEAERIAEEWELEREAGHAN